jgi:xylan 1,4-beta-xylosidase
MARWNGLIDAFARHVVGRYGLREVRKWRFEVWNEPDLDYFWRGTREQYFDLYANTARTLKAVDPALWVGGPATSKNLWVSEMLDFCRDKSVPIDFLSTHHYCANSALALNVDGTKNRIYHGQSKMKKDVAGTVEKVRASAFPDLEIHYTEWNVTPFHVDAFSKDSEFTAPFILQTVRDIRGLLNSYSFWTFTDVFEEGGPPAIPFSGLYGLLNFHGLKKPAYHAFHWYARLYDNEIPSGDGPLLATRSKKGSLRFITWNLNEVLKTDFTGGDWTLDEKARSETILLQGLKGRFRVQGFCIDGKKGNAYRAWQKMGSPQYLKENARNRLQKAAEPALICDRTLSCRGELKLTHTLKPCSVVFYDIEKISTVMGSPSPVSGRGRGVRA